MENFLKKIEGYQLLIIGVFFSLALIISTSIVANTLSRSGIEVTGSSVAVVESDNATWDIDIVTASSSKKKSFEKLVKDRTVVMDYLKTKGFTDKEIDLQNTNAYPVFDISPKTGEELNTVNHYETAQTIRINSNNIALVKESSLDVENLLDKGIDIRSNPPQYFYTKLADLKVKLLKEASDDARKRAKAMLKGSGNRLGSIKSIRTGVFQITTPNSTEVTDYGIYDTSTIQKKVTAVTLVTFRI